MDQLDLLTKLRRALRQRIAQAYFHGSILDQLALVALDGTARRSQKREGERRRPANLVSAADMLWNCCFAHVSGCAYAGRIALIQVNHKSDSVHCPAGRPFIIADR